MKIAGRHLLVLVSMCGLLATTVGLVTNVAGLFFTPVAEELGILKGEVSLMLTICTSSLACGWKVSPPCPLGMPLMVIPPLVLK